MVKTCESAGGGFFLLTELSAYRTLTREVEKVPALPYPEALQGMNRLETEVDGGRWGIFAGLLFPAMSRAATQAAQAEAQHRLDNLALAATAYRIRHGRFPTRPDDLVPEFMMVFPQDPFDGEPMRMTFIDESLLFYSIGADMKDDGGAEWNKSDETGDLTFRLRAPRTQPAPN